MAKNGFKGIIVLVIFAAIIIGSFAYLSNKPRSMPEDVRKMSAVQEVLNTDLDTSYPPTPKEVVKLYSEITRCFYGEYYDESQFVELADMSRRLFDDELRANQTKEDYLTSLKREIASYKSENRSISSFSVGSSANVDYYDFKDDKWAMLNCVYSVRHQKNIIQTKEQFLLRQDDKGRWKIFGWKVINEDEKDGQ